MGDAWIFVVGGVLAVLASLAWLDGAGKGKW
jgi:hypothetical protein